MRDGGADDVDVTQASLQRLRVAATSLKRSYPGGFHRLTEARRRVRSDYGKASAGVGVVETQAALGKLQRRLERLRIWFRPVVRGFARFRARHRRPLLIGYVTLVALIMPSR